LKLFSDLLLVLEAVVNDEGGLVDIQVWGRRLRRADMMGTDRAINQRLIALVLDHVHVLL